MRGVWGWEGKGFIPKPPLISGASPLGFRSLFGAGTYPVPTYYLVLTYLALSLFLSVCTFPAGAVEGAEVEAGAGAGTPGAFFRLEDGAVVIDWSPGLGFPRNSTVFLENSSLAGTENQSLDASPADSGAENGSPDQNATSLPFSLEETGLFGGPSTGSGPGFSSQAGGSGRPAEYGRRVTDLVGVFSIDMTIRLGSNLSSSPGTAEWIPCP